MGQLCSFYKVFQNKAPKYIAKSKIGKVRENRRNTRGNRKKHRRKHAETPGKMVGNRKPGKHNIKGITMTHTGKVGPKTWDLWPLMWEPGPQHDQVGSGTRDPPDKIRVPGPQNFQVGNGNREPWSRTLMNNLLAWKFECCNKSIDILLEN